MKLVCAFLIFLTIAFYIWLFYKIFTYEDQKEFYNHMDRFYNGDYKEEMDHMMIDGRRALEKRKSQ